VLKNRRWEQMDVNVATYYQRQAGMANICEKDETSVSIEDILS